MADPGFARGGGTNPPREGGQHKILPEVQWYQRFVVKSVPALFAVLSLVLFRV